MFIVLNAQIILSRQHSPLIHDKFEYECLSACLLFTGETK